MSEQSANEQESQAWQTARVGMAVIAVILLGTYIAFRDAMMLVGLFLGFIISVANYVFLVRIISNLLRTEANKGGMLLLFFLKLMFLMAILWLAFGYLKVNVVAFVAGFMTFILVLVVDNLLKPKT